MGVRPLVSIVSVTSLNWLRMVLVLFSILVGPGEEGGSEFGGELNDIIIEIKNEKKKKKKTYKYYYLLTPS